MNEQKKNYILCRLKVKKAKENNAKQKQKTSACLENLRIAQNKTTESTELAEQMLANL